MLKTRPRCGDRVDDDWRGADFGFETTAIKAPLKVVVDCDGGDIARREVIVGRKDVVEDRERHGVWVFKTAC